MSVAIETAIDAAKEVARAWRWRDVGRAFLIGTATLLASGTPLRAFNGFMLAWEAWLYHGLQFGLPLLFFVRCADRMVGRGSSAVLCYGGAAVLSVVLGVWVIARVLWPILGKAPWWTSSDDIWLALTVGLFVVVGVATYAEWRQQQRVRTRLDASLAAGERERSLLGEAKLLALQARVEPEMLFTALQSVQSRLQSAPQAAAAQLDDLITLLRTMIPRGAEREVMNTHASLASELALVERYARVAERADMQPPQWQFEIESAATSARLAPMLLLPITRILSAFDAPGWRLRAQVRKSQLRIRIQATGWAPGTHARPAETMLDEWQGRLRSVHGEMAALQWHSRPMAALSLQLPFEKVAEATQPAHRSDKVRGTD